MSKRLMSLVVAVLAMGLVAAVAVASSGRPAAGTVRVELSEGRLTTDRATVPAGRVTFEQRNAGTTEHELIVVRTDLAPDAIPVGLFGPVVKLAGPAVLGTPHGHAQHSTGLAAERLGASRHVRPGGGRVEAVTLKPGRYVLLCTLPGHYEAGQRAGLRVLAPRR